MAKIDPGLMKLHTCLICQTQQTPYFQYLGYQYFRCATCGHISTYPYPTKKQMEQHYKNKFTRGNYELLRSYAPEYKRVYQAFADILLQTLSQSQNPHIFKQKKILDVGCFTGEFLAILQSYGAKVYGLELQREAVALANKKLKGERVYQADVMSDAFPKVPYDCITLLGIVEHVTDPILLLQRSHTLLKSNGILMIQTPNSGSFFAKTMKKYWPPYTPVEHIHLFSQTSLTQALEHIGFQDIRYEQSWKKLPLGYVLNMLQNFGPELYRLAKPFLSVVAIFPITLPFYIGEMVITAKKK